MKIKEQLQYTPYEVLLKLKAQTQEENEENNNEESENEEKDKKTKKTKSVEKPKAKKSKSKPLERSARLPISTHKVIFESKRVNFGPFIVFILWIANWKRPQV